MSFRESGNTSENDYGSLASGLGAIVVKRCTLPVVAAFVFAGALLAQNEGAGLFGNGGFEEGTAGWQRAWGKPQIVEGEARSGHKCLKVVDAGGMKTTPIPYDGGFVYVSVWMRTEDVRRGPQPWHKAVCQYLWLDENKQQVSYGTFGQTLGKTGWTKYETTINAVENSQVKYLALSLVNYNCTGTTWWDDLAVRTAPTTEAYLKVPPLSDVEDRKPVVWPLPEASEPEEVPATCDTGIIQCTTYPDGRGPMVALSSGQGPRIIAIDNAILASSGDDCIGAEPGFHGYDRQRGYAVRYKRARPLDHDNLPAGEEYTELYRSSPIAYNFSRLWLPNTIQSESVRGQILLRGQLDRVLYFTANAPHEAPLEDVTISLGPDTTKPFIILTDQKDTQGVVIYHPVPPEIRRWYIEDYVVENELAAQISIQKTGENVTLTYQYPQFNTNEDGYCHSFDFYSFVMPYIGPLAKALEQMQPVADRPLLEDIPPFSSETPRGFWTHNMPLGGGARVFRMSRYFPREFSSWIRGAFTWRHKDGFSWGQMTAQMKGIRVNPLDERALLRDHALRMLTFFVERGNEKGAPGGLAMWRSKGAAEPKAEDYYGNMFCMYWEFRLGEFRTLLRQSGLLTTEEKERIYQDLNRAKVLYGPEHEDKSWTVVLPDGGLWFRYSDRGQGEENWFVVNTHTVSVGNCGELALMARQMGHEQDCAYWQQLFERGIDAMLWLFEQDWIWADYDSNELLYAKGGRGPRGYHRWVATYMVPRIGYVDGELDAYRLDEIVASVERLMQATYVQEHPDWVAQAQEFLDWAHQRGTKGAQ